METKACQASPGYGHTEMENVTKSLYIGEYIREHSRILNRKQEAFAVAKASWLMDYSFSKRYSRTRTCISSSRSILQIMLRALL